MPQGRLEPVGLIGQSAPMQALVRLIQLVAPTELTVLIRGERGTGKELVANALQALSPRRDHPYLKLNCAALPMELLQAELFGYVKGAFTGAYHSRMGLLVAANGGTLLLDEIGELSPAAQGAMLRVLQHGDVRPLGSAKTRRVDVRILAATNRDLEAAMAAGHFKPDLYDRLNEITLLVPPLRERPDDIPLLAVHFLQRASQELGRPVPSLTREELRWLLAQPWPGNVRELAQMLRRALLLGEAGRLALPPAAPAQALPSPPWLPLSRRQHAALTRAQAQGEVSVAALARQFSVSVQAVRPELSALVELGILRKVGATKRAAFRLTGPWETLLSPTGRAFLAVLFPGFPQPLGPTESSNL